MLMSKEHYQLMEQFERQHSKRIRLAREPKADWARGIVYQDGHVNEAFLVFRNGYAFGRFVERSEGGTEPLPADSQGKEAGS